MLVKIGCPRSLDRRGIAAVELAFLMPLLLGLIVGVWEIGRLVQLQQIMNQAARDGARIASQACAYRRSRDHDRRRSRRGNCGGDCCSALVLILRQSVDDGQQHQRGRAAGQRYGATGGAGAAAGACAVEEPPMK